MEHCGNPARIPETIRRFAAWRRSAGLVPPASATFTVFRCDPKSIPQEEFRIDLCAGTDRPVPANDAGVEEGVLPGGRCARFRITGHGDDLETHASWLYREWLPASGEELRDFPIFCERVRFPPEVPENEAVTDLYLPLR